MSNSRQGSRRVLTDAERGRNQREAQRRYRERNSEILKEQALARYYRRKAERGTQPGERDAQQNRPTIVIVENDGTEADPLNYEQLSITRTSVLPQDKLEITGAKDEYNTPVLPQTPTPINIVIVENNTTNPNLEERLQ